ncbi:MAG: radical SAM protein [Candidatus Saelkia tenebricola]|nr:radical SAM protein [Candidatus Saelkia tenebricola]
MKVILINPPLSPKTVRNLGPVVRSLFYNSPPLGLCYLGAVLRKDGQSVKIIDVPVEGLSMDEAVREVVKFKPDLIGLTTFTVSIYSCYELAKKIKSKLPGIKIIAGGPHINSNPEDLLRHKEIDLAVIGEGEVTFKELISVMERGDVVENVEGVAYAMQDELFFSPPREYIADLDILPFPARDLVPIYKYKPQPNDQKRLPKLSMITSRGCPYSCIFCDKSVFGNKYRTFSPEYMIREMTQLVDNFGARDIAFVDSTFTPNKNRVYKITKEIKKANMDLTWTCSVRADVLDKELLSEMKSAGCWRVRIGVESGNEDVLKFIKKGLIKYQVRRVAQWAYELDLEPKAFFMLGHLVDTKETIKETIDFACSLPLEDITVQINTPLKNTFQYSLVEKYGKMITKDLSKHNLWEPVFVPKSLSHNELLYYYRKFYCKFYLQPKIWYRHMVKIKTLSDVTKYFKGIKILLFFIILWWKHRK